MLNTSAKWNFKRMLTQSFDCSWVKGVHVSFCWEQIWILCTRIWAWRSKSLRWNLSPAHGPFLLSYDGFVVTYSTLCMHFMGEIDDRCYMTAWRFSKFLDLPVKSDRSITPQSTQLFHGAVTLDNPPIFPHSQLLTLCLTNVLPLSVNFFLIIFHLTISPYFDLLRILFVPFLGTNKICTLKALCGWFMSMYDKNHYNIVK